MTVILREVSRLGESENKILRRIFRSDENGKQRRLQMRNFMVCTVHLILLVVIKSRRL
jgi:hypothetical protein